MVALLWLVTGTVADGQTGPDFGDNSAAVTRAVY